MPTAHETTHTARHSHPEPNYLAVILVLTVLTAVEIAVTYTPLPRLSIGVLLVGLALTKACMVAMFFMHLKFEKTTLALIAATPLFLCTMLVFALLPDNNPKHHLSADIAAHAARESGAVGGGAGAHP